MADSEFVEHTTCYYCKKPMDTRKRGGCSYEGNGFWNAIENGERWPCHNDCIEQEERIIKVGGDWERGNKYSHRHAFLNPLRTLDVKVKCGCRFTLTKDSPEGKYDYASIHAYCWRHKLQFWLACNGILDRELVKFKETFKILENEAMEA